jgi:hypothetical protein
MPAESVLLYGVSSAPPAVKDFRSPLVAFKTFRHRGQGGHRERREKNSSMRGEVVDDACVTAILAVARGLGIAQTRIESGVD